MFAETIDRLRGTEAVAGYVAEKLLPGAGKVVSKETTEMIKASSVIISNTTDDVVNSTLDRK